MSDNNLFGMQAEKKTIYTSFAVMRVWLCALVRSMRTMLHFTMATFLSDELKKTTKKQRAWNTGSNLHVSRHKHKHTM